MNNLRQVCIFILLFYIEAWFTATSAILAPNKDLELMKKLISDKHIIPAVSKETCRKMKEHLWYLNNELATISLFDDNVSVDIKRKIIDAINTHEGSTLMDQRFHVEDKDLPLLLKKDLSNFVSNKSLELFTKFDFLEEDILSWPDNESYKICLGFFKTLKVTNDVAERGIALIEEYNCCITKDEDQLQYLLQGDQLEAENRGGLCGGSPLLYTAYANDIPRPQTGVQLALFADDTTLYLRSSNFRQITPRLQKAIDELTRWFQTWRIELNPEKSAAISFNYSKIKKKEVVLYNSPISVYVTHPFRGITNPNI
ncbi:RNA-directed DNA polymerase from mobile element jockey [Eumeta japonica]|uniref:RNA-directed DNA polymerase from mobile element jockey n=1 Tax=Eumeta variegata TaxID=151549 RepID=A0A4C1SZV4_EUMVA|nr:RNA-directed DNA polymerase from mobile element jockey [Eumeta japonica]